MSSQSRKTMSAWTFAPHASVGLDKALTLSKNATAPTPSTGQVLIAVHAMSVNPIDFKIAEFPLVARLAYGSSPASPGLDFAGVVVQSNGHDFQPGTRVFGRLDSPTRFGTLAQYIVAGKEIAQIPEGVSDETAAAVGTAALTSYQCLKQAGAGPGKRVFVNGGSGGAGTWGLQIAKAMGASVTTSCSSRNVELCKRLGADEVVDYTKQDLLQELKRKGEVFDGVVDNVGTPGPLFKAADAFLKPGCRFVQIGAAVSPTQALNMAYRMLWPSVLGGGRSRWNFHHCLSSREELSQLGKWIQERKIEPAIDKIVEWENAPEAYRLLKSGKAQGKIVVRVDAKE